jgi:DNA-binding transcriptional LysR family regulator
MSFGFRHIAPVLPEFLATYPDVSIDLQLSDAMVDLVGEGFDAAIRIAALPDSSLVARRFCEMRRNLVGSPAYLNKHCRPKHPHHLAQHRCIAYSYTTTPETWRFVKNGKSATVRPSGPLRVNNGEAMMPADCRDWARHPARMCARHSPAVGWRDCCRIGRSHLALPTG